MKLEIIFLCMVSIIMWGLIWYRGCSSNPLRWAAPISLFALGIFFYYLIPPLYWQFREWTYMVPPYFEGLPLVLKSTLVLGIPFLVFTFHRQKKVRAWSNEVHLPIQRAGTLLWVFVVPAVIGITWRSYLVTLGWQSRMGYGMPSIMGSWDLAMIFYNFTYYVPVVCFILILCGDKKQRRVGEILWVIEGILRVFIFSRSGLMRYMFLSFLLWTLMGFKMTLKRISFALIAVVFILSVIGGIQFIMGDYTADGTKKFLSPDAVIEMLRVGATRYYSSEIIGSHISTEQNFLLKSLDDAMYRMYDARSASAVMMCVPATIPFYYGKTFKHVLYSFIPRYFWPEKPNLGSIHSITDQAMYPEKHNPLGTIAELYLNYGYVGVFLGGILFLIICRFLDFLICYRSSSMWAVFLSTYPIFAEQLIYASNNANHRICEILRGMLVLLLMMIMMWFIRKHTKERL
ncbi:MAG: hypothetical protein KJ957_08090 [Candidatus Omnitrophica bacterium]|nr:hypothetical protein [Candidatus Omnitrophota bacterium]